MNSGKTKTHTVMNTWTEYMLYVMLNKYIPDSHAKCLEEALYHCKGSCSSFQKLACLNIFEIIIIVYYPNSICPCKLEMQLTLL